MKKTTRAAAARESAAQEQAPNAAEQEFEQPEQEPDAATNREVFDPGLVGRLWEEKTRTGPDAMRGGEIIQRHTRTFTMDGSVCAPGYFVDSEGLFFDFRVTMRSLSSAEEIEALQGIESEQEAPLRLAKACLHAINGKTLTREQRDHLWEAFGMGGRQLCFVIFQQIGSASASSLGKSLQSCTID